MSSTLLRTVPALRGALRASGAPKAVAMASTTFVRGKATLPDLSCESIDNQSYSQPVRKATFRGASYRDGSCWQCLDRS